MGFGITMLRMVVGGLFVSRGLGKLKGLFGGDGPEATAQAFEAAGLSPGKATSTAVGAAETAGGALLLTGFLTPIGAACATSTMAMGFEQVNKANGPWVSGNAGTYNLMLMAAVFAIAAEGPGCLSLDRARGAESSGLIAGLFQLGAGVGGALALVKAAEEGFLTM